MNIEVHISAMFIHDDDAVCTLLCRLSYVFAL